MTMEEMHEQRGIYVQRVAEAAQDGLNLTGWSLNPLPSRISTRPGLNTSTHPTVLMPMV